MQKVWYAILILLFWGSGVYFLPWISRDFFGHARADVGQNEPKPSPMDERKFIIIGGFYPPFEDSLNGKTVGIDAELLDPIFKELNVAYEIRLYPWTRAWWMATKGEADAVISVSYKSSRENVLAYSTDQRDFVKTGKIPKNYLYLTQYVFFVLKKNKDKLKFESYQQLIDDYPKIGTVRSFSYNKEFRDAMPKLNIEEYPTTKHALNALLEGRVDMVPLDIDVGKAIMVQMNAEKELDSLPRPLLVKPYNLVLLKSSTHPEKEKVINAVYKTYDRYRRDGTWDRTYRKYKQNQSTGAEK